MYRSCSVAAAVCLGLVLNVSIPAHAQPPATERRVVLRNAQESPTLADIVKDLSWDPAARGSLIIVAPEMVSISSQPPKGADGFTVNALAPVFNFRLIPCGTISAFAPATMKVLAARLGTPDIIGSMSRSDRLGMLQSSFTEQQWRQIASEQGLGANDLSGKQRDLFLSVLPDPIIVNRITTDGAGKSTTQMITLTGAQRASVRIGVRKRVGWGFPAGKDGNGTMTIGTSERAPNSDSLEMMADPREFARFQPGAPVFGATLVEEQKTRLKAGDLPFDWSALDPQISLEGAKTVGDLIARVRQATRVELYSDRRYTELTVVVRGTSARSGDVLTALCYGVTGTFRKVGDAFVLTDDREGLGSRMARILEWVESARTAQFAIRKEISVGRKTRPADIIPWDASDPTSTDAGLTGRIASLQKKQSSLSEAERLKPENRNLILSIPDLPTEARFLAEKQAEVARTNQLGNQEVRTDAVQLWIRETSVLMIPGVGVAQIQDLGMRRAGDPEGYEDTGNASTNPPTPEVAAEERQLIVAPTTPEEAATMVAEAQKRGFQRLWVAVRPEDTALVEAAVRAGKSAGIPVGAVVRVLRAGANTTLPHDIDLLGEDSTVRANRISSSPEIAFVGGPNYFPIDMRNGITTIVARQLVEREKRWGAWLRCDLPEVQGTVLNRITTIAKIPGLAGLVLRDLHAPGFVPTTQRYGYTMPPRILGGMGYSEGMRLSFLRKYSVDPVDLGPGNMINTEGNIIQVNLVFMRDYGLTGKYTNVRSYFGSINSYELGAKDAAEKWLEFRVEIGNRFAASLVRGLRAAAPNLPLWLYPQQEDPPFGNTIWMSQLQEGDAGLLLAAPTPEPLQTWPPTEGEGVSSGPRSTALLILAKKDTKSVSWALWPAPIANLTPRNSLLQLANYWAPRAKEGWQSVTFDLSEQLISNVPDFLDGIKFATPSPKKIGEK